MRVAFAHEAAAFSPDEGYLYLTEDNFAFPSGFYRYLPPNDPMVDGHWRTAASSRCSRSSASTRPTSSRARSTGPRTPSSGSTSPCPIRTSAPVTDTLLTEPHDKRPGAHLCRQPGSGPGGRPLLPPRGQASYTRGEIYFTSTQGGGAAETGPELIAGYGNGRGQVWSYNPLTSTLTCRLPVAESIDTLDFPDNITAKSDAGHDCPVRGRCGAQLHPRPDAAKAELFDIALNRLTNNTTGRAAVRRGVRRGHVRPGHGDTLFVNIQATAAITLRHLGKLAEARRLSRQAPGGFEPAPELLDGFLEPLSESATKLSFRVLSSTRKT